MGARELSPLRSDSAAFLQFVAHDLADLPAPLARRPPDYRRKRPCVVVLVTYSVPRSKPVRAAIPALAAADASFFYLPPYSPALNAIEPLWGDITYTTRGTAATPHCPACTRS
jgi:DDE superfamily endonuclease